MSEQDSDSRTAEPMPLVAIPQEGSIARATGCEAIMDKATLETLAKQAGLEKALTEFPDDVAAAAEQAAKVRARINAPADPRAEPWPPMRAGAGL